MLRLACGVDYTTLSQKQKASAGASLDAQRLAYHAYVWAPLAEKNEKLNEFRRIKQRRRRQRAAAKLNALKCSGLYCVPKFIKIGGEVIADRQLWAAGAQEFAVQKFEDTDNIEVEQCTRLKDLMT
eukprot:1690897-Karenia_brevis.AAC.1